MLNSLIHRVIDQQEEELGVSMDYLRELADASTSAFVKFGMFMPLSDHRNHAPPAAYHIARIVSTRSEDCGPCVQIGVNMARQDGVPPEYIRAVLTDEPAQLPPLLQDAYQFARTVAARQEVSFELRERLIDEIGAEGVMELSLGMATAQVFPILKRGMGHGRSCRLVDIDVGGEPIRSAPLAEDAHENGVPAAK